MPDRKPVNLEAKTTKEITGACIETISVGTEFTVTWLDDDPNGSSCCKGLPIDLIWNEEFELIK